MGCARRRDRTAAIEVAGVAHRTRGTRLAIWDQSGMTLPEWDGFMAQSAIHPASLESARLQAECDVRFARRSGPGGQNRNKVETAAILTHRPSGISAEASERRTQGENRDAALFRLRLRLALEVRTEPPDTPSPLWLSRCRGGRIAVNPHHEDFPALLAEALDALHASGDDPATASARLGCTTSQFLKLLKEEPRAFAAMNERRRARGQRPFL